MPAVNFQQLVSGFFVANASGNFLWLLAKSFIGFKDSKNCLKSQSSIDHFLNELFPVILAVAIRFHLLVDSIDSPIDTDTHRKKGLQSFIFLYRKGPLALSTSVAPLSFTPTLPDVLFVTALAQKKIKSID